MDERIAGRFSLLPMGKHGAWAGVSAQPASVSHKGGNLFELTATFIANRSERMPTESIVLLDGAVLQRTVINHGGFVERNQTLTLIQKITFEANSE